MSAVHIKFGDHEHTNCPPKKSSSKESFLLPDRTSAIRENFRVNLKIKVTREMDNIWY